MKPVQVKLTVRKIIHLGIDQLGHCSTFTVDENNKQNSPSFESYGKLWDWANQPWNYVFKAEMKASN